MLDTDFINLDTQPCRYGLNQHLTLKIISHLLKTIFQRSYKLNINHISNPDLEHKVSNLVTRKRSTIRTGTDSELIKAFTCFITPVPTRFFNFYVLSERLY
jgi:hypothetical protein